VYGIVHSGYTIVIRVYATVRLLYAILVLTYLRHAFKKHCQGYEVSIVLYSCHRCRYRCKKRFLRFLTFFYFANVFYF